MSRMNKIEDLLHKEIANIIVTRIDNPQIKNTVTITDIKVSKDIRSAVVYFVTLDKNGIPNLYVRIDWHGGQFENSDKDSRDPSRFRHILLYIIY